MGSHWTYLGIAQIAFAPAPSPPPAPNQALWGTSFLKKCPKPSWLLARVLAPQNQGISSQKSWPKPSGEALIMTPPPHFMAMPK